MWSAAFNPDGTRVVPISADADCACIVYGGSMTVAERHVQEVVAVVLKPLLDAHIWVPGFIVSLWASAHDLMMPRPSDSSAARELTVFGVALGR